MSRCWSVVLLAAALLGPLLCEAGLNTCRTVDGFVLPEDNSYIAYDYTVDSVSGNCDSVTRRCSGSVPRDQTGLSQRTWFINPVKNLFGQRYRDRTLEIYKVQCPPDHLLHLFPQSLDVPPDPATSCDLTNDFITIERGLDTDEILCGTDNRAFTDFYNNGQGVLVETGNATITFCTDEASNVNNFGFVIRATCIDPSRLQFPGCVSFQFFMAWDPEFADLRRHIPLDAPERFRQPHKRSAMMHNVFDYAKMARNRVQSLKQSELKITRSKRFTTFMRLSLEAGQSATYRNHILTLDFNDGTTRSFLITRVDVSTPIIGTRTFFRSANNTVFNGPADIEIQDLKALIIEKEAPSFDALFLPTPVVGEIVNIISDYVYENYVRPYPIIEESGLTNDTVPLRGPDGPGNFVRFSDVLLVREGLDASSTTCRRAAVEEITPVRGSESDRFLNIYCRFFAFSCDPYLSAICNQVVLLDTIPR